MAIRYTVEPPRCCGRTYSRNKTGLRSVLAHQPLNREHFGDFGRSRMCLPLVNHQQWDQHFHQHKKKVDAVICEAIFLPSIKYCINCELRASLVLLGMQEPSQVLTRGFKKRDSKCCKALSHVRCIEYPSLSAIKLLLMFQRTEWT